MLLKAPATRQDYSRKAAERSRSRRRTTACALERLLLPCLRTVVGQDIPCRLPSRLGGVAMRPLILHESSKAATARARRVVHIEYADSLDVDDGLRIAIA